MYLLLICLSAAVVGSQGQDSDTIFPNFMDTLTVGFRLASSFLNSKKNDIVSTVFKSFREIHETYRGFNGGGGSEGYLPFFIRLLGVNSAKMESYAFDGFIFLAHLINMTLTNSDNNNRKHRASSVTDFSPFEYLIQQPKVRSLLTQMEDPNMVEIILSESDEKLKGYDPEDVECIPLLICKTEPFVRGMQKSLKFFINRDKGDCYRNETNRKQCQERQEWENADSEGKIFFFLPALDEVIKNGDKCDERFPKCIY